MRQNLSVKMLQLRGKADLQLPWLPGMSEAEVFTEDTAGDHREVLNYLSAS